MANGRRQPHAAAKVRTPRRQTSNATLEASLSGWQHGWHPLRNTVVTTRSNIRSNKVCNAVKYCFVSDRRNDSVNTSEAFRRMSYKTLHVLCCGTPRSFRRDCGEP